MTDNSENQTQASETFSDSIEIVSGDRLGPMVALDDRARRYIRAGTPEATRRAYAGDVKRFKAFCDGLGLDVLPSSADTVIRYISALAEEGLKVGTIRRALASISKAHKSAGLSSPTEAESVKLAIKGIAAEHGSAQKQAPPTLVDDARNLVAALDVGSARGSRDAAMILIGFAAALRRSEIVGLDVGDAAFVTEGVVLTIRKSKTDQTGEGAAVAIHHGQNPETCPVRALRRWMSAADITTGPVFRTIDAGGNLLEGRASDRAVDRAIKRAAKLAGLDDRKFSGHSLRAGLATQAALNGHGIEAIARQCRHKNTDTTLKYIRIANRFSGNVTKAIGL